MRRLLAPLPALLLCAGCGGSGQEAGTHAPPVAGGLDQFQAEILADDDVTDSEMARALEANAECLREQGMEAEVESFDPVRGEWSQSFSNPRGDISSLQRAQEECEARYLSVVEGRHIELTAPSEEQEQRQMGEFIACLTDRDLVVKSRDYGAIMNEVPLADFVTCHP
jgi:hypothetical protein